VAVLADPGRFAQAQLFPDPLEHECVAVHDHPINKFSTSVDILVAGTYIENYTNF